MNALVSVVVVTCGKNDYYRSCLQALARQTHALLDIILVDNSFNPAVARQALAVCPALRMFVSIDNLYYCGSMNKGIELSRGEFVLCLNDDVELDEHFIEEALRGFKVHPSVGMVSGKILRLDRQTLDSTGLFLSVWRTARERGYSQPDRGQFETAEFVFGVSGAAAFYRRTMLDHLREKGGWFDPDFRIFYEDLDLSWRANRKGWRGYYVPAARAYHARGGSVRSVKEQQPFARQYLTDDLHADLIKNRYLTMIKNESPGGFLRHFFPMVIHDLCAWGYVVFFRPGVFRLLLSRRQCFLSAWNRRRAKARC